MFGALMEEKHEVTPEWEAELKDICESTRKGGDPGIVLRKITHLSKAETKMKLIRKTLRKGGAEWSKAVEEMNKQCMNDGFKWMTKWGGPSCGIMRNLNCTRGRSWPSIQIRFENVCSCCPNTLHNGIGMHENGGIEDTNH
jgi:hypothetical protein